MLTGLIDSLTGYIETRIALVKIEFKEELAKTVAKLIIVLMLSLVFMLFIAFFSLTAGAWLNTVTDSQYLGYAIIALFYLLLFLLIFIFRNHLGIAERVAKSLNLDLEEEHHLQEEADNIQNGKQG